MSAHHMEPMFLESAGKRVFVLYLAPPSNMPIKGAVLCVPPFGEEMNRTRSLMSETARSLAQHGYATALLDLYGTGDSEGDLPDATWDDWLENVSSALAWLGEKSREKVTLWGVRLGALVAAEVANRNADNIERLLAWQPVINGKMYLTQVLRLRVAALVDRNSPPETTEEMREKLAAGNSIEVSGYIVPGSLAMAIDQRDLSNFENLFDTPVHWLECVADESRGIPLGSRKAAEKLSELGVNVVQESVVAAPIWTLPNHATAPALKDATLKFFGVNAQ